MNELKHEIFPFLPPKKKYRKKKPPKETCLYEIASKNLILTCNSVTFLNRSSELPQDKVECSSEISPLQSDDGDDDDDGHMISTASEVSSLSALSKLTSPVTPASGLHYQKKLCSGSGPGFGWGMWLFI